MPGFREPDARVDVIDLHVDEFPGLRLHSFYVGYLHADDARDAVLRVDLMFAALTPWWRRSWGPRSGPLTAMAGPNGPGQGMADWGWVEDDELGLVVVLSPHPDDAVLSCGHS